MEDMLDEIRTEPITNDHLVLQGDHDDEYHRQVMDRLDLTRGSLHSDQTRLRTPVKLSPSSTLSVHRHQATELNVIGQWRSSGLIGLKFSNIAFTAALNRIDVRFRERALEEGWSSEVGCC